MKKYEKLWKKVKKKYPIGVYVQGTFNYSYPQGHIIKGDDFIAIYKGDEADMAFSYRDGVSDNYNFFGNKLYLTDNPCIACPSSENRIEIHQPAVMLPQPGGELCFPMNAFL